ncbi:MAG TPA: hypothetical protein VIO81_00955 [Methyloversatilis sp.]
MTLADLKLIRGSALLALAMAMGGGGALWASARFADEVSRGHASALDTRSTARRGLASARAEETEIAEKIDRFRHLVERGAIGSEQRLAWVELIRDARARHQLGALDYEFSPQHPLDPAIAPSDAGQLEAASSALRLRLPLLHEGDLLTLIDDLTINASALVRVRECSIARRIPADTSTEALQADCLLDWITFRPRTGAGS